MLRLRWNSTESETERLSSKLLSRLFQDSVLITNTKTNTTNILLIGYKKSRGKFFYWSQAHIFSGFYGRLLALNAATEKFQEVLLSFKNYAENLNWNEFLWCKTKRGIHWDLFIIIGAEIFKECFRPSVQIFQVCQVTITSDAFKTHCRSHNKVGRKITNCGTQLSHFFFK